MIQWLKYIIVSVIVIVLILFAYIMNTQQNANDRATSKIEAMLESSMLGYVRANGVDGGISKKAFVANLVDEIVENEKTKNDVVVFYAFLDEDGKQTEDEQKIDSVQFKVAIVDGKGYAKLKKQFGSNLNHAMNITVKKQQYKFTSTNPKTYIVKDKEIVKIQNAVDTVAQSISIKRISLNSITKRTEQNPDELEYRAYASFEGDEERTFVVSDLSSPSEILSIEVLNDPTATATGELDEESGDLAITFTGGKAVKQVQGASSATILDKEVEVPSNSPLVDKSGNYKDTDGYKGILDKKLISGGTIPETRKFVSGQTSPEYSDAEGFRGKLVKSTTPISGYYRPSTQKVVTGQSKPDYSDAEGFTGKLSKYTVVTYPDAKSKVVKGKTKASYSDKDGYVGTLDLQFDRVETKPVSLVKGYSDLYDFNTFNDPKYATATYSDANGYEGILKKSKVEFVPKGGVSAYSTKTTGITYSLAESEPKEKLTPHGYWKATETYKAYMYEGVMVDGTFVKTEDGDSINVDYDDSDGELSESTDDEGGVSKATYYFPAQTELENGKTLSITESKKNFERLLGKKIFTNYNTFDDFVKGEGNVLNANSVKKVPVYIHKWTYYRTLGTTVVTYTGNASKNIYTYGGTVYKKEKNSIAKTSTYYKGIVTRKAVDTRVYGYEGFVKKQAVDNREYLWAGTVSKSEGSDAISEAVFGYDVLIKYKRN